MKDITTRNTEPETSQRKPGTTPPAEGLSLPPEDSTWTIEGTGGELVAAQARAAGVKYIFANPGSFESGLFDALTDAP